MSKEANPLPDKLFETESGGKQAIGPELNGEIERNRASAAMDRVLRHGTCKKQKNKLSFLKRFKISL